MTVAVTEVCWICGAGLHRAANTARDEYTWTDASGSETGDDPDLPPDPYGHWAALRDTLGAAQQRARRKGVEHTWLYWALSREYSMLHWRLTLGTWHVHRPTGPGPPWQGEVPTHCASPAWLRPSGWYCRECGEKIDGPPPPAAW